MKTNELMLGNYYLSFGVDLKQVETLHKDKILIDFQPIQLTEKWLLKFGFKKDWNGYFLGMLSFSKTKHNEFMICVNDLPIQKICKYVHQLQNLYFALTGEELTFKSE